MKYLPLIDGAFFIDNSFLEEAMACSRLSLYVIFERLRLSQARSALAYGGIIHKALEARYASGESLVSDALEEEMLEAVRRGFDTFTPPEGDFRTLEQALTQIRAYNKEYPVESFKPIHPDVGRTEIPFAIPFGVIEVGKLLPVLNLLTNERSEQFIDTLPIFYSGRIDLAFRTQSGEIRFMDHKTSSMGGASLFDPFYTGSQMKGYCWALSKLLNQPVRTYMINALIGRKPTRTGQQFAFARDVHTFHDELIEEWEETTRALLNRLLHCWQHDEWPMEPRWCVGKFGKCDFFDVCQLPPTARDTMLRSALYEQNDWNPIDDPQRVKKPGDDVLFL